MKRSALSLSVVATLLLGVAVLSWAGEIRMTGSTLVPSAEGVIKTEHDRNRNVVIDVEVYHLAPPQKLNPPRSTYVVWVQRPGEAPQNQGELRVNRDLRGSLKAPVPYPAFDVFITPEDNPQVTAPTGPDILRASVGK